MGRWISQDRNKPESEHFEKNENACILLQMYRKFESERAVMSNCYIYFVQEIMEGIWVLVSEK